MSQPQLGRDEDGKKYHVFGAAVVHVCACSVPNEVGGNWQVLYRSDMESIQVDVIFSSLKELQEGR